VLAIGVAYDEQKVPAIPRKDYDQRLDGVLTPSGLTCLPQHS
jgi:5-formyltetrahydrofolate cyclo-ligase